jgi:hypothetical protein
MAAGTISRIRLENFMCHSSLQIELGSHVNFITGQNGSTPRPLPLNPSVSPFPPHSFFMDFFSYPRRCRREERHPHGALRRLRLPRQEHAARRVAQGLHQDWMQVALCTHLFPSFFSAIFIFSYSISGCLHCKVTTFRFKARHL